MFGIKLSWDNRHQLHTSMLQQLSCRGNYSDTLIHLKTKELLSLFRMRLPWDIKHQPINLLLWLLGYHGNQ